MADQRPAGRGEIKMITGHFWSGKFDWFLALSSHLVQAERLGMVDVVPISRRGVPRVVVRHLSVRGVCSRRPSHFDGAFSRLGGCGLSCKSQPCRRPASKRRNGKSGNGLRLAGHRSRRRAQLQFPSRCCQSSHQAVKSSGQLRGENLSASRRIAFSWYASSSLFSSSS